MGVAVSQKEKKETNWFLGCLYKFKRVKSYVYNFWVAVVKNRRDLLGYETVKSTVSQDKTAVMTWLFFMLIQIWES